MVRRALKSAARKAVHSLGILNAVRHRTRRGCRILTYHRFPEDRAHLERQCEHIRRYYHPVTMTQVARAVRGGSPLPDNALTITVDDGFRDFIDHAHPVLARFDIPATVFLVTDFLDGRLWLWFNLVEYMAQRTPVPSLEIPGDPARRVLFGDQAERKSSGRKLIEWMKRLPDSQRRDFLGQLPEQLRVELPAAAPPEYAALTWGEARTLAKAGVEFGPHTKTHPILARIEHESVLCDEISGSKARIDTEIGAPAQHFCYPNGGPTDFDDRAVRLLGECGFATAVTMIGGLAYAGDEPFRLKRLPVDAVLPDAYFAEVLAGLRTH